MNEWGVLSAVCLSADSDYSNNDGNYLFLNGWIGRPTSYTYIISTYEKSNRYPISIHISFFLFFCFVDRIVVIIQVRDMSYAILDIEICTMYAAARFVLRYLLLNSMYLCSMYLVHMYAVVDIVQYPTKKGKYVVFNVQQRHVSALCCTVLVASSFCSHVSGKSLFSHFLEVW